MKKRLILCVFLLLPAFITLAHAFGPEGKLSVTVTNPPEGDFTLTLDFEQPEEEIEITTAREEIDGVSVFTFTGAALPERFSLVINAGGETVRTREIELPALQSAIVYDHLTGEFTIPSVMPPVFLYFGITFPAILLIEGLMLLPFGLSLAKNWKPFLLINFLTQAAMTFTAGMSLVRSGTAAAFFILFPMGLLVMIAETLLYEHFFEAKKPRIALAYGMMANLVSWVAVAVASGWLYGVVSSLLL